MKTSLNKTVEIEKFLQGVMAPQDVVLFQAKLLVNEDLGKSTLFQRLVYRLVKLYGRKKAKATVEALHSRLFDDPRKASFRESILKNFKT